MGNFYDDIDTVSNITKETAKYFGLDYLDSIQIMDMVAERKLSLCMYKDIEMGNYRDKGVGAILEIFEGLEDSIRNSPLVAEIEMKYEDQIKELNARIAELEQYETHFNMEKKLRSTEGTVDETR